MNAIEFTTELSGTSTLTIPHDIAAELPKSGRARVIVLTEENPDDARWEALLSAEGVGEKVHGYFEKAAREGEAEPMDFDRL